MDKIDTEIKHLETSLLRSEAEITKITYNDETKKKESVLERKYRDGS